VIIEIAPEFLLPAMENRHSGDLPQQAARAIMKASTKEAPPWILAPAILNQASPMGAILRLGLLPPPPSTK